MNLKVCILGTTISAYHLLNFFKKKKISIQNLVTISSSKAKKLNISGYTVKLILSAKKNKIKIFNVSKLNLKNERDINFFKKEKFDIGICTGWQRLIPQQILSKFKYGVFGWHGRFLKLPHGAGRSPLNWSIRLGQKVIFHHLIKYNNSTDLGDIFEVSKIKITKNDYISDIQSKVNKHICKSSLKLLSLLHKKKLPLLKQAKIKNIIFPKIEFDDCKIFTKNMSTEEAYDLIRSTSYPFPGSYLSSNKKKVLLVYKSKKFKFKHKFKKLKLGTLFYHNKNLYLKLKDGFLLITDYKYLINKFSNKKILFSEKIICD